MRRNIYTFFFFQRKIIVIAKREIINASFSIDFNFTARAHFDFNKPHWKNVEYFLWYRWIFHMFHSFTSCLSEEAYTFRARAHFFQFQQSDGKIRPEVIFFEHSAIIFLSFSSFSRTREIRARKIRGEKYAFIQPRCPAILIHFYFLRSSLTGPSIIHFS